MPWVAFWWESTACKGAVRCDADWQNLVQQFAAHYGIGLPQAKVEMVATAALCPRPLGSEAAWQGLQSIGTQAEHIGGSGFRAWAEGNGMIHRLLA